VRPGISEPVPVRRTPAQVPADYFDSLGVARLYAMTFDGRIWTLERTKPDLSPLEFHQRFVGSISTDGATIDGEWQGSDDRRQWRRDFGLTYTRIITAR
jgi:hypothetical protein